MTKLPQINCDAIRKTWKDKKSVGENLTAMGLIADPNKDNVFSIPSVKSALINDLDHDKSKTSAIKVTVPEVAKQLEETAKEGYKAKNSVKHPLPPEMYKKLTKFIDKHGEDYEAMSRDHENYYQETAAQLRSQVARLKKIPQQWIPYLKSRNLLPQAEQSDDSDSP